MVGPRRTQVFHLLVRERRDLESFYRDAELNAVLFHHNFMEQETFRRVSADLTWTDCMVDEMRFDMDQDSSPEVPDGLETSS